MSAFAPTGLTITPRNVSFPRDVQSPRWWHGGDPVATTFYNGLSLSFPQGEGFFVQSVRHYIDVLPEPLRTEAAEFAQQEAYHSREHMAFNRQVTAAGYDAREIDALNREDTRVAREQPPEVQLAGTAALEHFTAMLAHALLADPRHFANCPPDVRRLWMWHAIEEIEHKAVAFDTLMYVTRDMKRHERYLFRVVVMFQTTVQFWKERKRDFKILFQQDGLDTPKTWRSLAKLLLLKPGILRQLLLPYLAYYLPGFHPWKHDDRKLAAGVERSLGLQEITKPA